MMEALVAALDGTAPDLAAGSFVAPGAVLLGRVLLARRASVWYGSVLRGDDERIELGQETNVQDASVLHADPGEPTLIGDRVSLGHGAIVHGAVVEDDVLVGIRATVLTGARIGTGSVIAAGAVVRPGTVVPPGSLVVGVPGQVRREVTDDERAMIANTARDYVRKAELHRIHVR